MSLSIPTQKMLAIPTEFQQLMQSVREGSQEAAWRIAEMYGPHIQRVVRRHLDRRIRSKFDSVDFVQAVWVSFFRQPEVVRRFDTPEQLVGHLAVVARNKVTDELRRRLRSQKANVGKERSFDEMTETYSGREPTPSQVAVARERWENLVNGQTETHQQIIELRFQGMQFTEIAERLHLHERSVRKVMERLLRQLD